jgi:signal transduction histidine kinase/CheY-like chemotaxis protein
LGDDLFQQVEPFTRRALAGEHVTFDSVYWSPDDKACHFLVNYVPDLDADQNVIGFFVLAIDITERKHADAANKSLESQLRESQKMEALGTLSSGIAHDFNNALAAILGNAELAQKEIQGNELLAQYLGEIYWSGIRSKNLVQQILSYCRQQPTELRPIPLAAVVHDAMAMLKSTLPVRFSLIVHCAAEPSWILADRTQIEQVIINLVTNAAQAIGSQSGTIEIGVDLINANAPELAICPLPAGPFDQTSRVVRLSVSDDGPGIAPKIQDRLFEPFFTTKPLGEGTGLGLSVVQGIVKVHGASIHLDSEPGKGAKFSIYFPEVVGDTHDRPLENEPYQHILTTDAVAAVSVAASNVAVVDRPIPNESRHVLLIDDDASVLKMSTLMLERLGYTVSAYDNPLAALDAVRNDPTAFQIVITDYNMPVMPGLEIAAAVRDLCPDLPVVVISGYVDDQLRTGAARTGVAELISKPFTVREFSAKIERVLR